MKFAKWVFLIAALYGVLIVTPQFFLELKISRDYPPAITHPEYFYGFAGVALAWQVAFFIIASDPVRYRPMMLAGVLEKASFGFAALALFLAERLPIAVLVFGLIDLILGVLFIIAWWSVRRPQSR